MFKQFVQLNKRWCDNFIKKHKSTFGDKRSYTDILEEYFPQKIDSEFNILEAGGTDRPLIDKSTISDKIQYNGLDIEHKENCYTIYHEFHVQSIEDPIPGQYDLIISRTLLEHVPNNDKTFTAIYNALKEDGLTVHYVPSKFHPYSIILRMVGNKAQKFLIKHLRGWSADVTGYPTYFNYCSPKSMKKLLESKGFKDIKVLCLYDASDYFAFFAPAFLSVILWQKFCSMLNIQNGCCGFVIEAKR